MQLCRNRCFTDVLAYCEDSVSLIIVRQRLLPGHLSVLRRRSLCPMKTGGNNRYTFTEFSLTSVYFHKFKNICALQ